MLARMGVAEPTPPVAIGRPVSSENRSGVQPEHNTITGTQASIKRKLNQSLEHIFEWKGSRTGRPLQHWFQKVCTAT
jgi:hypothetical protein